MTLNNSWVNRESKTVKLSKEPTMRILHAKRMPTLFLRETHRRARVREGKVKMERQ